MRRSRFKPARWVAAFALVLARIVAAGEAEKPEYHEWSLPVSVSPDAPKEVKDSAIKLADALNTTRMEGGNIGCCFLVELETWKPNPSQNYFLIVIQGGGAVLKGTNAEQIAKGIDALKAATKKADGKTMLPEGILTNLKTIKTP